jgi:phosphohistidine swiveling domain-containing protein
VDGLWRADAARIEELQRRHAAVMSAPLDTVSRIYWLLEDCKRYGTLPFAGLARAAFIATQMLRSMVTVGVLSAEQLERFMCGIDSVSSGLVRDFRRMEKTAFLSRYGHLRPGTYDILSPRYDETPDRYFDWSAEPQAAPAGVEAYIPSTTQKQNVDRLLVEHRLEHTAGGLFEFLESAIRNREHAKFVFTRSLSDALSLFGKLGAEHGFTTDDISFASIACIHRLYGSSEHPADVLGESIAQGRERHRTTRQLLLSPLLTEPADVWRFHQPGAAPNFITRKETVGTVQVADPSASLERCIVLLPNADPGYDWIFSRGIAGFVTAYGGVNSHMAVRAGELGLPAVIGAGERLYDRWARARRLRLDCLNRHVQILQ